MRKNPKFAVRYKRKGFIFDDTSRSAFPHDHDKLMYYIGLLCSNTTFAYLQALDPTMSFTNGDLKRIPILYNSSKHEEIEKIVKENISISRDDWNSYEMSWDFKTHPIIQALKDSTENNEFHKDGVLLEFIYQKAAQKYDERFYKLKNNEELLNSVFIEVYGLNDELKPDVEIKDITVSKSNILRDITSFISYVVGCMFGRYSLDVEGLAYAGGDWKKNLDRKYKTFLPDEDAIIPITDEEYFKDDIVARFVDFVRIVYGEETLEENLKFIADALGSKGDTSRAVIRNYFLNNFYKDHCNTYSVGTSGKRPVYWLFDSGKQNGFKALIYIHRYTPDTVGLIRSKYLHNAQAAIQNALQNSEYIIASTTSATERARETKKRDKYVKQLNELRPYYQALTHIALQRIPMDLDDGVKKNYQLFQNVEISTEGKKKQSINLLAKI